MKAYADAMIRSGRDAYGRQHSPLFAAALDRDTMQLGSRGKFGRIEGVRETDRSIGGAKENNQRMTATGYLPALAGADYVWPTSNLELARCLWAAAPQVGTVDQPLAKRMQALALRQDENFLRALHEIAHGGGFAVTLHSETGKPRDRAMNKPYTAQWASGYGYSAHARPANLCHERMRQLSAGHAAIADGYRALIIAAAEQYLTAESDQRDLQKPDAFAEVIQLLLNAAALTHERRYLERADHFGRLGCRLFLDDRCPLPRATNWHDHYETITGGPDFMWSLLELDQALKAAAASR